MDSKQAMAAAFGTDTGRKLYTVAAKLANRYGIDTDDVASEITLTALDSQTRYGFIHINTVAQRVKNALYDTYAYGVNRYFAADYAEIEADEETEDGGSVLDMLETPDTCRAVDVKLLVESVLRTLKPRDRAIVAGMLAGLDVKEIAAHMGAHIDTIYKRQRAIAAQFTAAMA